MEIGRREWQGQGMGRVCGAASWYLVEHCDEEDAMCEGEADLGSPSLVKKPDISREDEQGGGEEEQEREQHKATRQYLTPVCLCVCMHVHICAFVRGGGA